VSDSQFKQIRVRRASVMGELSVRQEDWILRLKPVDLDNLPKYRAIVGGLHNQAQGSGDSRFAIDNQKASRSADHGACDSLEPMELIVSGIRGIGLHSVGNSHNGRERRRRGLRWRFCDKKNRNRLIP
jgi:hypothetical protein